jgi:phospho-N-acetylmuramoyl-pentapeptide-transferase
MEYDIFISFMIALIVGILAGPIFIPVLRILKFGQRVRSDGPNRHLAKAGTPTMGGLMILAAILAAVAFTAEMTETMIILLVVTIGNGLIGFLDDFIKVVLKRPLGLKAREKILGQVIIAALLAWYTVFVLDQGTDVILPLFGDLFDLGLLYFPFVILVVVATTNTVNLTDGLDGLAVGITFFVAVGLILLTGLLNVPEAAIFSGALAGACLSFLKYNSYPAKIFMGDTGSLALGGAVAAIAVVSKLELFLPLLGGIFVFEGLSVIIQVISFKLLGKRVFRMSPLHHHFELGGWPERKVVRFFWFGSVVMVLLGVFSFR